MKPAPRPHLIIAGLLLGQARSFSTARPTSSFLGVPRSINEHRHLRRRTRPLYDGTDGITVDSTVPKRPSAPSASSIREMLKFALPALGIFLANPLLSNIDNAFVGQTAGAAGLAALSPATVCTDQMLYLFSFLARATTGLVSRAYDADDGGNVDAARDAASAPLTVSILCGLALTVLYAFFTPGMLSLLRVDATLLRPAASYIHLRGLVSAAALAQSVSLSTLLATKDAVTPLKIVATAAIVNVIGDALFCMVPFRWGCGGAAAATSLATLASCGFMLRALKRKRLLPSLRVPTKKEMLGLFEFTGPLLAITVTRLVGFIAMQKAAMRLGVLPLAAFQLGTNVVSFFLLFAEPLSQLSQTYLPSLVDKEDGEGVFAMLKSVLVVGLAASLVVGATAFATVRFGASLFTSDTAVQLIAKMSSPAVFLCVATTIMMVTVDGAMLASRDFGFILVCGVGTCLVQLQMLKHCTSLNQIFHTFTLRLGAYAVAAAVRAALGYGRLGRVLRCGLGGSTKTKDVQRLQGTGVQVE